MRCGRTEGRAGLRFFIRRFEPRGTRGSDASGGLYEMGVWRVGGVRNRSYAVWLCGKLVVEGAVVIYEFGLGEEFVGLGAGGVGQGALLLRVVAHLEDALGEQAGDIGLGHEGGMAVFEEFGDGGGDGGDDGDGAGHGDRDGEGGDGGGGADGDEVGGGEEVLEVEGAAEGLLGEDEELGLGEAGAEAGGRGGEGAAAPEEDAGLTVEDVEDGAGPSELMMIGGAGGFSDT